jgi:signal transduction histidine kinase
LLWEVDRQVPQVLVGDVGKIQQCLLNLVGNALKFTHEGSVTIRVTVMDQQEISSSSSNKSVSIDAGMCSICLSQSCFKSIFAPFPKGF